MPPHDEQVVRTARKESKPHQRDVVRAVIVSAFRSLLIIRRAPASLTPSEAQGDALSERLLPDRPLCTP